MRDCETVDADVVVGVADNYEDDRWVIGVINRDNYENDSKVIGQINII